HPTPLYTLSLHDALPISVEGKAHDVGLLSVKENFALAAFLDSQDLSLIAGARVQAPSGVEGQRPDIFGLGIVKDFRFSVGSYAVDFAVRRAAHIQRAVWTRG